MSPLDRATHLRTLAVTLALGGATFAVAAPRPAHAPSSPVAPTIKEFAIPRPGAFPHDPAVGPDGIVWYTDQANSYIGRLDPATGRITDYPTPTPRSGPHGIIVGPDGMVWYTGNANGRIGKLDPKTGKITEYVLPSEARDPHTPAFQNGKLWFTVQQASLIGALDPATGHTELFRPHTPRAKPYGLVPATGSPDLWAALFGTNKLAHIVTATGEIHEIELPHPGARPRRLVVDADGNVWYTDYARSYLGFLNTKTHATKEWHTPSDNAGPYGIAIGPDGRIWFDEARTSLMVAFDPKTEKMETVPIPTKGAIVRNIAVDSARHRIWLALSGTGRIGLIDLSGTTTARR